MKKTLLILLILLIPFITGCYKAKRDYLSNAISDFSDGFETYTSVSEFIGTDIWNGSQLTISGNELTIDTTVVHSGNKSLKCSATTTQGDVVSKAGILKNNLGIEEGGVFYFECWYYLESIQPKNIFIADFEEPAAISSSPGFRLMLNEEGALCVERRKMTESTLQQTVEQPRIFPLQQWVRIQLEVKLSQRNKGYIKLWQNGELILDHDKVQTMPRDMIYVTQGTSGVFRQVEIGLTANGSGAPAILYVDDFVIRKIR
ncbi:MAG: heparin lyase I family protein [Bacteroidota bacterium]